VSKELKALLDEQLFTAAEGVLGSMLIDEEAVGPMLLAVEEEDFQVPEHRNLFRAMKALYSQGKPHDVILINEFLGGDYGKVIEQLVERTPTAANADAYAQALKKSSRLWQLRQLGDGLNQAVDEEVCRRLIDKANLLLCERSGVRRVTMEQAFRGFFKRRDGRKPDYLSWGFSELDGWLHVGAGDMVVIGGQASAGKTALSLQMAFRIARDRRVGFFSYETDADKLADRNIACQTQTSFSRIMEGRLEREDYSRIRDMRPHLTSPVLELLETPGMTVSDMGSYAMAHHYSVIVVDYLQKIPAVRGGRPLSEFERVSQVSSDLQQLGRRTGMTVIALSQLSRAEKRRDGKIPAPTLASLRQSGQIEQDADVVMLLYKEFQEYGRTRRCLDVAKNKDGMAGVGLLLDFDGDKQCFRKSNAQPKPETAPEQPVQQSMFRPIHAGGPTPFDKEERK
jgi:replicative DNA helicase